MKLAVNSIACFGLILVGSQAFAADSGGRATMTKRQMMIQCIERQKAADVSMSKTEMTRTCKGQLKQQKTTGALPESPPKDVPQN